MRQNGDVTNLVSWIYFYSFLFCLIHYMTQFIFHIRHQYRFNLVYVVHSSVLRVNQVIGWSFRAEYELLNLGGHINAQ